MWTLGMYVKLHTNDEWNNLYGIVDEICGDMLAIVCVIIPCYRYYVSIADAIDVLEIVDAG